MAEALFTRCSSGLSYGKRDECESKWRVKVAIFRGRSGRERRRRFAKNVIDVPGFADSCCDGARTGPFDVINGSNGIQIDQIQILEFDFRNRASALARSDPTLLA